MTGPSTGQLSLRFDLKDTPAGVTRSIALEPARINRAVSTMNSAPARMLAKQAT